MDIKQELKEIEKAIEHLERLYTPSVKTYEMKKELYNQYVREWYELVQKLNKPLK